MPRARRLRGALLRLALNRRAAIPLGALIACPGLVLMLGGFRWETGATDGLALIALATGLAILWAGVTGRRGDWVD
jgi:hypothetical protein